MHSLVVTCDTARGIGKSISRIVMKARHIISIVILALSISSCCVPRKCPYFQAAKDTKDSTYYHVRDSVIYKDSTIYYPIPMEESSNTTPDDSSHIETSLAASDAWIEGGLLHHSLRNKEQMLKVPVRIPQYLHHEVKNHLIKVTNTVEVEKPLKWWQKILCWAGAASIVLVIIKIGLRLGKIKLPFL